MKMFWILCAVLSNLSIPASHDAVMATFRITEGSSGLMLDISFDRADYAQVNRTSPDRLSTVDLQAYLQHTTSWMINGEEADLIVQNISVDNDHFEARCILKTAQTIIDHLHIRNTFLIPIADHSNVVLIDLNGVSRDYRMHGGRLEIEVCL